MRASLLLLLLLTCAPGGARAALSNGEVRAVRAVDAATPEAIALLERLVNQNSGTGDTAGVRAVGQLLAPRFAALGLAPRWVDGAAWGRAGHLLASHAGRHARLRVLLIGHLDTVFEADSPFQRWERLSDSTARGPGINDMKGGDVEMLLVIRALQAAGAFEQFDLRVVLTGDEELPGTPLELARADLLAAARDCDVALGFECGSGDPGQAMTARRGSSGWRLRTWGRRAHSSQIFRRDVGAGAVFELARILDAFRDSLADEPHLTFNAGLVLGGSHVALERGGQGTASGKANVVPESALATGDLRALTRAQVAHARAVMTRIAQRHLPGTGAELEFEDGYPPLAPAAAHDSLLAIYDRASRDLGLGPVVATRPDDAGAADIANVDELVPMALDGIGLPGSGGHTVHEDALLPMLAGNAKRVAVTLLRLAAAR